MQPVYRWNGQFFGYMSQGHSLFDASLNYRGFATKDDRVWRADGSYLGELVDHLYVLRPVAGPTPAPQAPQGRPTVPLDPIPFADLLPRAPLAGSVDALDEFP